jgi:hypothetical protein
MLSTRKDIELAQFPFCKVDTLNARFQEVVEAVKTKTGGFLESSTGNIFMILFDLIMGEKKEFKDAISYSEVM